MDKLIIFFFFYFYSHAVIWLRTSTDTHRLSSNFKKNVNLGFFTYKSLIYLITIQTHTTHTSSRCLLSLATTDWVQFMMDGNVEKWMNGKETRRWNYETPTALQHNSIPQEAFESGFAKHSFRVVIRNIIKIRDKECIFDPNTLK